MGMLPGERVAELVRQSAHGPLLGKGVEPVLALPVAREGADVLDDAFLLVIGLLHQEGIVLDARWFFWFSFLGQEAATQQGCNREGLEKCVCHGSPKNESQYYTI